MVYRRPPQPYRRFSYQGMDNNSKGNTDNTFISENIESLKEVKNIPLPTEVEEPPSQDRKIQQSRLSMFLDSIRKRIGLEEIILLGLIFLLIQEHIDDELLLIVLVYILLS